MDDEKWHAIKQLFINESRTEYCFFESKFGEFHLIAEEHGDPKSYQLFLDKIKPLVKDFSEWIFGLEGSVIFLEAKKKNKLQNFLESSSKHEALSGMVEVFRFIEQNQIIVFDPVLQMSDPDTVALAIENGIDKETAWLNGIFTPLLLSGPDGWPRVIRKARLYGISPEDFLKLYEKWSNDSNIKEKYDKAEEIMLDFVNTKSVEIILEFLQKHDTQKKFFFRIGRFHLPIFDHFRD